MNGDYNEDYDGWESGEEEMQDQYDSGLVKADA